MKNNILIDSDHNARIADFGLTSLLRHPSISISVTPPAWGGTYRWMAPELFDGKSRPSKESDIYALGMVIYEVCRIALPDESALMDHPRRSLQTSHHSPTFLSTPYLREFSLESDLHDQQTGVFWGCQRASGC